MVSTTKIKYPDDIGQHLERLRADITTLSETVTRLASEGALSAQSQLSDTTSRAARRATAAGQQVYQDAAKLGHDAIDTAHATAGQLESQIARNPMTAVFAALGLGFAVGLLSRRQ